MEALVRTLVATFVALLCGYAGQAALRNHRWGRATDRWSSTIKHALILYVTPVTLVLSFWTLNLKLWMLTIPFLGVAAHLVGGLLGLGGARRLRLAPPQAGSMFVCGMMSNLTSFGGLVSYMFFGEPGFALGAVYRMLEPAVVYGVGFPVSAALGGRGDGDGRGRSWVRRILLDPYILVPNLGLLAGVILNALDVPRLETLAAWNPILIIGSSLLMVFAIGLTFRPGRLGAYIMPSLTVASIKFVALPLLMGLVAYGLGYGQTDGGLPFKIVITMSAMPVAFNALVPPTLFGLDLDLANSSWLVTTAGFFVMLPLLYLVLA
ncbi:MAG TPA: hypothetical protein VF282_08710 [Bacillota bacterium]